MAKAEIFGVPTEVGSEGFRRVFLEGNSCGTSRDDWKGE